MFPHWPTAWRRSSRWRRRAEMRVAVAYQDGEIYGHFGHCPMFAVYEYGEYVSNCTKKLVDSSARSGHQQMADLMKELALRPSADGGLDEGAGCGRGHRRKHGRGRKSCPAQLRDRTDRRLQRGRGHGVGSPGHGSAPDKPCRRWMRRLQRKLRVRLRGS